MAQEIKSQGERTPARTPSSAAAESKNRHTLDDARRSWPGYPKRTGPNHMPTAIATISIALTRGKADAAPSNRQGKGHAGSFRPKAPGVLYAAGRPAQAPGEFCRAVAPPRHRSAAGRVPAHAADKERRPLTNARAGQKHRSNQRSVGQTRSAAKRIIQNNYIAVLHVDVRDLRLSPTGDRMQMHRQTISPCAIVRPCRSYTAREESSRSLMLGKCSATQRHAHLLGNGDEQVLKTSKLDPISVHGLLA